MFCKDRVLNDEKFEKWAESQQLQQCLAEDIQIFSGYSNKKKISGAKECNEHPLQKKPAEL